jgi:putative hydrolase of the HAD superfamily
VIRAVVFDLWQTLVPWPSDASARLRQSWADDLGVSLAQLDGHWYGDPETYRLRESGPLAPALIAMRDALGSTIPNEELMAARLAVTREALVLRPDVGRTLAEIRARGFPIGLVSNCTEDVALVWPESALAPLVDHAVFSATAGCMKPDARIYHRVCEAMSVDPAACVFVGDGANDELAGAAAVGMTPVLIAEDGVARWDGLDDWPGARITSIPDVLELLP